MLVKPCVNTNKLKIPAELNKIDFFMPKPTQMIRGRVTWRNHQVCVGIAAARLLFGGNEAFQQSQLFIIRSWKCGESAGQLQQEVTHVRVYSSQNKAERSTLCNKWDNRRPPHLPPHHCHCPRPEEQQVCKNSLLHHPLKWGGELRMEGSQFIICIANKMLF